jgi:hypothetical protein
MFDTSRCHAFFHAFELDLTFGITNYTPQVSLRDLLPSRIDRFHLKHIQVQSVKVIPKTRKLLHTVKWTLGNPGLVYRNTLEQLSKV